METRKNQTTKQTAHLVERRTKLSRYIARFRVLQIAYSPAALQALAERPVPTTEKEEEAARVENVPLFLPSALTAEQRANGCNKGVVAIETRLRDAQCRSALDEIRNILHIKSRFHTYKGSQVRHQGATTRTRGLLDRNDERLRLQAEKYVAAWEAKRRLVGDEEVRWHRLNPKKDLRCMEAAEDGALVSKRKARGKKRPVGKAATEEERREGVQEGQRGTGHASEGRRTVSWIWMGVDTSAEGTNQAILAGMAIFSNGFFRCIDLLIYYRSTRRVGQGMGENPAMDRGGRAPEGGNAARAGYAAVEGGLVGGKKHRGRIQGVSR